ncbi:hypothetical protein [Bradyrhizobium sp.]|jgi:hypothetical protein|uniref:hypothetical protein n=1 Tax=Bradyrhizobium sp. TaxID=376 RepID=UPI003C4D0415
MNTKTEEIRTLNDRRRQNINRGYGHAVMTAGIAALGVEAIARIIKTIEVYDDFCHANVRTRNTTLARSKPTTIRSSSRSIITDLKYPPMQQTP